MNLALEEVLHKLPKECIISGSIALKQYGMLRPDREVHDIDVVVEEKSKEELDGLFKDVGTVTEEEDQATRTYIEKFYRVKVFNSDIIIDVFVKPKGTVLVMDHKLEHYRTILKAKVDIICDRLSHPNDEVANKHTKDLQYILNHVGN